MKIALYTINLGNYDTVNPINPRLVQGIDCFLFTDNDQTPEGWTIKRVNSNGDPHRKQREIKIMFHKYLPGYDVVVYMDANMTLTRPLMPLIKTMKGDILTSKHPHRDCVYEEGYACIDRHKADPALIKSQLADYMGRGIRPRTGMYATCLLIRKPTDIVKSFSKLWLEELNKFSHRDQLSIIPARDHLGVEIETIQWRIMQQCFRHHPHNDRSKKKIHYIVPYNTNKNIGKAVNDAIEQLGADDDDWIVLRDGDTCFLTPQWGKHIEDALMKAGSYFSLIGCMTNRIGSKHQRIAGMYDEVDMTKHYAKAVELQEKHYAQIEEIKDGVAGFLMAFPVKVWKKHKFPEGTIQFDTGFYKLIRNGGGKVGLMKGLYIFHMYRLWAEGNARREIQHLI